MLNRIWGGLVAIGILTALVRSLVDDDATHLADVVDSTFAMSRTGFEIALGLTGVMTLWLGIMRIGEDGGAVGILSRLVRPLFRRLFPSIPDGHPAHGSIVMNMAANMLGLDNAATPAGLKAMKELQELNPDKDTATNEQILFLVINTSAVTIVPIAIFTYRAEQGAADPTDVFVPLLIATFCSTLVGLLASAVVLGIRIWDRVVLGWLGGASLVIFGLVAYMAQLPPERVQVVSAGLAHATILGIIGLFVGLAAWRKVPIYESFVEGAKDGFQTAIRIIPYLVAMLIAIGIFRASGALDAVLSGVRWLVVSLGADPRWVDGLPTALMKPLSGSGARGLMVETMETHGADSFAGRLVSIIQGSTETTFYVLAVYFGSVGIRRPRQAVALGLLADLGGIIAAIFVCYFFFG